MKSIKYFLLCLFLTSCIDTRIKRLELVQNNEIINISIKKTSKKVFDLKIIDSNKVLVLNFFTSTCGVCKEEFKSLNKLNKMYSKDVIFLGLLGDKRSKDFILKFIKKYHINYYILSDKESVSLLSKAVAGVSAVPLTYIFDKNGKLVKKFIGLTPYKTLKKEIYNTI